ncbi:MAG: hypothetical protein M1823_003441 [Watsoniomyces obsoletus]|nr:MAG: hypothetical protein M1823_003441 [Watsoniomyces obsoletus]
MSSAGAERERPTKRLRRLSSEYDDSDAIEDWMPVKKPSADIHDGRDNSSVVNDTTSRSRRGLRDAPTSTTPKQTEDGATKSIKLTVKPPVAKAQDATNGTSKPTSATKGSSELGEVVSGPRGTRAKQPIIDESESDEEEEEEEEEGDEEEDAEGEEEDADGDEDEDDEEQDESEEEDDEEEDEEEEEEDNDETETKEETPVPVLSKPARPSSGPGPVRDASGRFQRKAKGSAAPPKGRVQALAQSKTKTSPTRRGSAGGSSSRARKVDEDEEGDDQGDEEEEEDSDEDEDDESTLGTGSRGSTPDISKMTKRQRSRLESTMDGDLLALPDEVKAKKILSAEEHAMRRAEMARRRKNLSEKRKEEEKMETINKLLKKQAPKQQRRSRLQEVMGDSTPHGQEAEPAKPNPGFVRWISNAQGTVLGVPQEWLDAPVGRIFQGGEGISQPKKMAEESVRWVSHGHRGIEVLEEVNNEEVVEKTVGELVEEAMRREIHTEFEGSLYMSP